MNAQDIEQKLLKGPYHQWLGLKVGQAGEGEITLQVPFRDEFVVNPAGGYIHGGILATLIDLAADWALVAWTGRGVPTLNLHVDYHRPARGDLTVKAKVIKRGKLASSAEAWIYDAEGRLVASGRGLYATPAEQGAA
ncbi:PaaI family thioesterase [Affinibrenneria salicis]|uniref:PaaI family thioesterase n=1 Tax=Affinibrenneria salicis TaxID=2590031 RepID=A0A5J5G7T8_9GAMM|nr:PaaI family thioesterase [Affinibrenneria salicis]KAA9002715.1 PaaI family thioesterase [Affinibrenneria salicis]KAA9002998.1 PaaI family thioesterase [Affinibrenneria salicis]